MTTRVYQFGCPFGPTENAELVREQMRRDRAYGNDRVRAESIGRDRTRPLLESCEDFASLKEARDAAKKLVDKLDTEIKRKHASTRSRSSTLQKRAELKDAKHAYKAAASAFASFRFGRPTDRIRTDPELRSQWEEVWGKLKEKKPPRKKGEPRERYKRCKGDNNEGLVASMQRSARAARQVHWGTYQRTDTARNTSFASTPWYDDNGGSRNPRFMRKTDRRRIAVHFQDKDSIVSVEDLFVGTAQAKIEKVPAPPRGDGTPRETKRTDQYVNLHIRVGHRDNPGWATFPMVMHRPLPEKARVSWIVVTATPVGRNLKWTCEITCSWSADDKQEDPPSGTGTVAVVFNWSKVPGGIQAARWLSSTGEAGAVVLGEFDRSQKDRDGGHGGIASGIRRAEQLRSDRDKLFNSAIRELVKWLRPRDMPEWMRARTSKRKYDDQGNVIEQRVPSKAQALAWLSEWKSQARLAALVKEWRGKRIEGDSEIFGHRPEFDADKRPIRGTGTGLEGWRYHDFHLWQYESHQRESSLLRRREVYRRFAADLRRRFGFVLLDGTQFSELKRKTESDEKGKAKQPASDQQLVSPGDFREIIEHGLRGASRKVEPEGTATTCPVCGSKDGAQRESHQFACAKCPMVRDKDMIRLLNILKAGGFDKEVDGIIRRQEDVLASLRDAAE